MNRPLRDFDHIHASEQLKKETLTYVIQHRKKTKYKAVFAIGIAMLCLLISYPILSSPSKSINDPYVAVVSLDINPSMEFYIDKQDQIVEIKTYNEEAKEMIQSLELQQLTIDQAIDLLIQDERYAAYFEDGMLEVGIYSDDDKKSEELNQRIQQCLSTRLTRNQFHCSTIDKETRDAAIPQHTSMGKYRVIEKIIGYDSSYTIEELSQYSMVTLYAILEPYEPNSIPPGCRGMHGKGHGHKGNGS